MKEGAEHLVQIPFFFISGKKLEGGVNCNVSSSNLKRKLKAE